MKTNVKLNALLCALLVGGSVTAHADWNLSSVGDDGNPHTNGNAGAKQAQTKTQEVQITIFNKTTTNIASLKFVDNTGKALSTVNVTNCKANSLCSVKISPTMIKKNGAIFMYDQQNKLASVYSFLRVNSQFKNISILADASSLGIYALSKMQASQPKVNYTVLAGSIGSLGQQNSPFTVLGTSILDQMSANGQDLNKALAATTKELLSGKKLVLTSASVKKLQAVAPAIAVRSNATLKDSDSSKNIFCNAGVKSLFGFMSAIGGSYGLPSFGVLQAGIGMIATATCGGDGGTDYAAQFSKISAQISGVSDQVAALSTSVKGLAQNLNWQQLSTNVQQYNNYQYLISTWIQNYFNLLNMKGKDGKIHGTLKGLVDSYGGLQMALKDSPIQGALSNLLTSAKTDLSAPVNALSVVSLGSLNYQTIQSLQNMCGKSSDITGDAFAIRGTCNAYIGQISLANGTSSSALYTTIIADVLATYNESPGNPVVANLPTNDDIKKYYTTFNQDFMPEKIAFKPFYENELPKQLVSDIAESTGKFKCKINEWNPNGRYLLTSCNIGGSEILSRYYYKEKNEENGDFDAEVMNVMGIFVPKRFFHGGTSSYGNSDVFPWLTYSYPAYADTDIKSTVDDQHLYYFLLTPSNVAISYYGTSLSKISTDTISENMGLNDFIMRNGIKYQYKVLYRTSASNASNNEYYAFFPGAVYWVLYDGVDVKTGSFLNHISNDVFGFMRYTDKEGISHVWTMRNRMNLLQDASSNGKTNLALQTSMQCMTNDCELNGDTKSDYDDTNLKGQLKFRISDTNYLEIGWTPGDKNKTNCTDQLNSFEGRCEYKMTVNGKPSF